MERVKRERENLEVRALYDEIAEGPYVWHEARADGRTAGGGGSPRDRPRGRPRLARGPVCGPQSRRAVGVVGSVRRRDSQVAGQLALVVGGEGMTDGRRVLRGFVLNHAVARRSARSAALLCCVLFLGVGSAARAATDPTLYAANSSSNSVTPIDVATGLPGAEIEVGAYPDGLAVTPDGKTLYVANGGSGSLTPIDVATGIADPEIKVGGVPRGLAVTPDGKTLYVANILSEFVTPIDVATGTPGPEIKVGREPYALAVTPDGKTLYVANYFSSTVTPIDVATGIAGPEIKVGAAPTALAVTPNGKTVYVTTEALSSVTPIDVATGIPEPEMKVASHPGPLALSPNGKTLYVARVETENETGGVIPINVATGVPGPEIKLDATPASLAVTPNAKTVYVGGVEGLVTPINLADGMTGAGIKFALGPVDPSLAITPVAPRFIDAKLTNLRFRVGRHATALTSRRAPVGTTFRFMLDAASTVKVGIKREIAGLKRGARCFAPTRALLRAHAKRCTWTVPVFILTRTGMPWGEDTIPFSGRIGHRFLLPGRYDAVLTASDAVGRSNSGTLHFSVVR